MTNGWTHARREGIIADARPQTEDNKAEKSFGLNVRAAKQSETQIVH